MVKIPTGDRVTVNLWDSKKKRGLVKYFTHTMNLVNAESDFHLEKGDKAVVIKSFDSFVVIIPDDRYIKALEVGRRIKVNRTELSKIVSKILLECDEKSGGVLSIMELLELINKTSLKYFVERKDLKKLKKIKERNYDIIKDGGDTYFALHPAKTSSDIVRLIEFAKMHDYINYPMIKSEFRWKKLRIERDLEYLESLGIFRVDSGYRLGSRYYLIS